MQPILIVEDEKIMRDSLKDWLTDSGYPVDTAEEGEKALKMIDATDFGFLILDLKLPGKDGIEVFKEAREKKPQINGVIITAYPSFETARKATDEGLIAYLTKPVNLNYLEQLAKQSISKIQVKEKPAEAIIQKEAVSEEFLLINKINDIVEKHRFDKMQLIGILQDLQSYYKWLPREGLEYLAKKLNLPVNQIYHVATFFKAFHLKPRGKHTCTVCLGTACHVRGGQKLLEKIERDLNTKAGESSSDLMFSLEAVNCVGACALGPVVILDDEYFGHMTNIKTDKLLKDVKKKEEGKNA